jgi:hypothetical protein
MKKETTNVIDRFTVDEDRCIKIFDWYCVKEIKLLNRLFDHLELMIMQINGKVQEDEHPNYFIATLLVNNYSLLYNSYQLHRKGYLGISQMLLRSIIESIALCMYFFEFPYDEKLYRKNHRGFYSKLKNEGYGNWIEGVLKKIDEKGNKFAHLNENEGKSYYTFLFKNIGEEASEFVHGNIEYIADETYMLTEAVGVDTYSIGPNPQSEIVTKNGMYKIIDSIFFNTIVFDRVFRDLIPQNDGDLIRETVDILNVWSEYYSNQIKVK